jgi:hypothetical protein
VLLDDIIALATDNQQPLSVLLRKCLILAHELHNDLLKNWVNSELNGYPAQKELPDYRVLATTGATGVFTGQAWMQVQKLIPSNVLKPEHRGWAERVKVSQSIKSLEHLLESPNDTVSFPWDANLVLIYQDKLFSEWILSSAYQSVPKSAIAGIVDTIRNRALDMALELKSEVGDTDEALKQMTPQKEKKADQTITNVIYGNVYVAAQQSTLTVQHQNISVGDWSQLEKVLQNAGLAKQELHELSEAVRQDGQKMGSRVESWVKTTAPKMISGGVKIAVTVGQALLTEYMKQYFGLT